MKKEINQARPEGIIQPEIRPGDIWQDRAGSKITITNYAYNRVTFVREGYESPCICSPDRLRREFVRVENKNIPEWCRENNPAEKTKKLRELIQAGRVKK